MILGRPERRYHLDAPRDTFEGKRVLITGAGGSIASELARRILELDPAELVLLNHSEAALYAAAQDAGGWPVLADVRDAGRLVDIFTKYRPDVVLHAAAIKHVPFAEDNPCEAILTNVLGTANVLDACAAANVGHLVHISTDKAVNPTSVMGATKRAAELLCHHAMVYARRRITLVRFGNVLGSSGSVLPAFEAQFARGGPLQVTHPEVSRYFMTTREAVSLTLLATVLEQPVPSVFVLDAGEPVKILDLAKRFLSSLGQSHVPIEFPGLRPGEKLHEELFYAHERPEPTKFEGVLQGWLRWYDATGIHAKVDRLCRAAERGETELALTTLWGMTR